MKPLRQNQCLIPIANISNADISYFPVVRKETHIETLKNATTSLSSPTADKSEYAIANSEYNKTEKKSVTFN